MTPIIGAVLLALASMPDGMTCSDVRLNVSRYGERAAIAWARQHGWTPEQIETARKCLRS